jgi:hypothetical protein
VARTVSRIRSFRTSWRASPEGQGVRAALTGAQTGSRDGGGGQQRSRGHESFRVHSDRLQVQGVIAGLGNVDPDAGRDVNRAMVQLAMFLEVLSFLAPRHDTDDTADSDGDDDDDDDVSNPVTVPAYAQDPCFTSFDAAVLAALGITVLPGSDALAKVDAATILFVPFVDAVVLVPQILKGADPGLYIGTDVAEILERVRDPLYAAQTGVEEALVQECRVVGEEWARGRRRVDLGLGRTREVEVLGLVAYWRVDEGDEMEGDR